MNLTIRPIIASLFLCAIASSACTSSDDDEQDGKAATGQGGSGQSERSSPGKGPSCVYEYSTEFVCYDTPFGNSRKGPEVRCDDKSQCGYDTIETETNNALDCTRFTYREQQRVYDGTCEEFEAIVASGGEPVFRE